MFSEQSPDIRYDSWPQNIIFNRVIFTRTLLHSVKIFFMGRKNTSQGTNYQVYVLMCFIYMHILPQYTCKMSHFNILKHKGGKCSKQRK